MDAAGTDVILAPGLIDLQVNGCAGIDVNAAGFGAADVAALTRTQWERGVTRFCPTIVTAPEEHIVAALRAVADARRADPLVRAAIPGVHVEGPHVSPEDGPRGAHDPAHVRPADPDELERWQAASGGLVRIVTIAPETAGAVGYIRAATAAGILVSIGHTAASPAQLAAAVDAGARMSTHLGNGIAATLPRHPNPIWTQLSDDRLTASFIADGHHLDAAALTAMLRAKGPSRSVLVSDSTRLTGCAPGDYDEPVGGRVTLHPDGKLTLFASPLMAGSACSLDRCVDWAARHLEVGLAGAVRLASDAPARLLGLPGRATFEAGTPADITLCRFDDAAGFQAVGTVLDGVVVAGGSHHDTG
ncbi:N-acetylglucosamine-6-phosphate deacetylase [Jiangella asiatica]|uniref:N-acetylglucosamine-6-phosphate deacetylase n=1 Tax=Jiangella asiatica TaxID=2530372 RepID=A0A4R5CR96_9ACTN|nr:N-acetylglucosamine-6-phosphate deacetylase [Jiangella asiatica]